MSTSSIYSKVLRISLKLVVALAALMVASWLLTTSVQAETGLTIKVTREQNILVAEATTVEGSDVVEDSWRWIKSEDCSVELFATEPGDGVEHDDHWTAEVSQEDAGHSYCFYAEDSDNRKAVVAAKVAYPVIVVEQQNDQLIASVVNTERDDLVIDTDSWRWYRYHAVENSRFGCDFLHFDLDDSGLRQAADRAGVSQEEMFGEVQVDVYELQKDVYLSGQGSTVNLTDQDENLNFCFQVLDTGSLGNLKKITIGPVEAADNSVGSKDEGADGSTSGSTSGNGNVGQVSVNGGDDATENNPADDGGGSNVIRNIGLLLLAVAVVVGVFMLIKRSQDTEDEEEEI